MISCVCPTYNRAPKFLHLLEETVESFVRQRHSYEAELLILNDCEGQLLTCKAPWVKIFNRRDRFPSIGAKLNYLVNIAKGNIILPWDDDDISLPGRIDQAVMMLNTGPRPAGDDPIPYWKPPQVWYLEGGRYHWKHSVGVRHHASCFTKKAWAEVGGYPNHSRGQDAALDSKLLELRRRRCSDMQEVPAFPDGLPPEVWCYIYRWGVSDFHHSGFPGDLDEAYRLHGLKPVEKGAWEIVPRWSRDYEAEVKAHLPCPHGVSGWKRP